ncbi:MAG: amidohydrolase [Pirellulaceae bacterium]
MLFPRAALLPCRLLLATLLLSCLCGASIAADVEPAETVLLGGKIVTLDAKETVAEAIAVRDGKIVAVGDDDDVRKLIGDKTTVVQLDGKTVVPGFIETHCHAIGVAWAEMEQPYVELTSIAEIQDWLRRRAREVPPGRWIRVPRTDVTRIRERRHPTPAELDAACSTHPVWLNAARKNVLNTLGIERAEIDDKTETLGGGEILRDAEGRVRMIAGGDAYLRGLLPRREFTLDETLEGLQRVHVLYNRLGITSIFERAANREGYDTYQELRRRGKLTVRTNATIRQQFKSGDDVEKFSKQLGLKTGDGDDWIRVGPLKITVDGGIHWGNTYLREPYGERRAKFYVHDDPNFRGQRNYTVDQMADIFAAGHRLGWQLSCHVTGDAGVDAVLDAVERVAEETTIEENRFALIHAYFPAADAVDRARRLGMCVDTQGYLYYKDSDAIHDVYGREWAERFIGVGDWVKEGVPVAVNSDHMSGLDPDRAMNAFNPMLQLYVLVTRKNEAGRVYGERQKLSRIDALRCLTSSAAYLSFDEEKKGTLETGKLADLAVLDRDYLTCDADAIRRIGVVLTMVDGRIVHWRK